MWRTGAAPLISLITNINQSFKYAVDVRSLTQVYKFDGLSVLAKYFFQHDTKSVLANGLYAFYLNGAFAFEAYKLQYWKAFFFYLAWAGPNFI